jgi:hypothetical protein
MVDEPNSTTPVEPVVPVETPEAPSAPKIDEANIRKQARYFATHPEAADLLLAEYDNMSGGKLNARVNKLEMDLETERIMRKHKIGDDQRDLIEAPTIEGVEAKAAKVAAMNAKLAEAGKAPEKKDEPVIEYPKTGLTPKNELEFWEAQLLAGK